VSSGIKSVYRYSYGTLYSIPRRVKTPICPFTASRSRLCRFATLPQRRRMARFRTSAATLSYCIYCITAHASSLSFVLQHCCFYYHPAAVHILFGTFNRSTATVAEAELSHSLQTAFANFAKDPVNASPAPNWSPYQPDVSGASVAPTLAKISYHGNVHLDDFIEPVEPGTTVSMRNLCVKCIHSLAVILLVNGQPGWTVLSLGPVPGFSPLKNT
jgi:hypothetical protein